MNKLVSVIIPTYNRGHLVERAVNSALKQTYQHLEVIVVDDGSTDNTKDVMKRLENERVKYIREEKNHGACHARNLGIQASQGEYISFLDSDDYWCGDKLEEELNYLCSKKADVVVCNYWIERNGDKEQKIVNGKGDTLEYKDLLYENSVTTGALLVKKDILLKIGGFDELMPRYQDWDLILRLAKEYSVYYLDKPLLTLCFQENSITNSTSYEKKFFAIDRLIAKNKDEMIKLNPNAYSHHCWSMGLYSTYMNRTRWDLLKIGCFYNKFDLRRFSIVLIILLGGKKIFQKYYSKNH